jgi:hypothetical protein
MSENKTGIPTPEFRETLRKAFNIKKPEKLNHSAMLPIHDKPAKDKPRSVGNVQLSAEAQRIYNPQAPPVPIKQPNAQQAKGGTAPAMDTGGPWGTPEGAK